MQVRLLGGPVHVLVQVLPFWAKTGVAISAANIAKIARIANFIDSSLGL